MVIKPNTRLINLLSQIVHAESDGNRYESIRLRELAEKAIIEARNNRIAVEEARRILGPILELLMIKSED